MALLFVDSGAIRSLSSQPLTTAFLTRMVLAQRIPSLFTAAQILRGAPLSILHFFSPLGVGGAGATPRRVRAAYSRTRCLPYPKGWASAQQGVSVYCDASVLGMKTAPRHNRPQRGQHHVSLLWRCMVPSRPPGGPHKPSQGRTRGSAFLGCGVQLRWAAIGGEYRGRKSTTCFQPV